jgi:nitronate monooxygenase
MSLKALLGIDLPIIQAPMAGAQGSAMAIAVSNAGGLGSLPCAMLDAEGLRRELAAVRAGTSNPFNVNFFCHRQPEPDPARDAAWMATLAPYYRECGIEPSPANGPGRAPFSPAFAEVLAELRPLVVSFHYGLPEPALLDRVRQTGARILSSATTVDEARWLESRGVDVIIAQGAEAGGHRGMFLTDDLTTQVGTFALLPQIVAAVRIPVIAAGGIGDARSVAAAFALGAAGVQAGSAFLLCPESTITPLHRAALQGDGARHTALTNVFTGRPARSIVNRIIRELGPISPAAPAFPLAMAGLAPLRSHAERNGSPDFTPLWCGQNPLACRTVTAAERVRELSAGCPAA